MTALSWLPVIDDWAARLGQARTQPPDAAWPALTALARARLDLVQTERLARTAAKVVGSAPSGLAASPVRVALVGSCTLGHLAAPVRVAAMRRNLYAQTFVGAYGQYLQELADDGSALRAFRPDVVLFSLDARHLVSGAAAAGPDAASELERALDRLAQAWRLARSLGAQVVQQTLVPVFPALVGSNEHRLAWSPRALVQRVNAALPARAEAAGVALLALDRAIERDGIAQWYDAGLWHRTKQEIHPAAAPLYGDLVGRLLAARAGRAAKCLVLDLDNTLWGGVVGDDGLEGIALGQGDPLGEAHVALQAYARELSRRGIILAVCSKNDEASALAPFERHPDMVLRRADIACFVANWDDKATNLRRIARALDIGLDALVFVDDNPFERNIVRRELPMVEVPELGGDPSTYVGAVADAGYFEALAFTAEDAARAGQYRANAAREAAREAVTDVEAYLGSLGMRLFWRPFDALGRPRIAQLINKCNQFNLTTRRYTEEGVRDLAADPSALTFQLRLTDEFGDNGMIGVVVCRARPDGTGEIDTWLMSCRVLGRGVEAAALNLLVAAARSARLSRLEGWYLPTAKNGLVADHYGKLGFHPVATGEGGARLWRLDLDGYRPRPAHIETVEG